MGQTVYHGVAKNVYVAKEALIGSRLASSLGAVEVFALATQRGNREVLRAMPKH